MNATQETHILAMVSVPGRALTDVPLGHHVRILFPVQAIKPGFVTMNILPAQAVPRGGKPINTIFTNWKDHSHLHSHFHLGYI
jgi:hypothetical protein